MFGLIAGGGALPNKSDHNDDKMTAIIKDPIRQAGSNYETIRGTGPACCRFSSQGGPKEIGVDRTLKAGTG